MRFFGKNSQSVFLSIQSQICGIWRASLFSVRQKLPRIFRKLAEQLDARLVLEDWDEGIVVELKIPTSSSFGIVHSLSEDSLFLRRIYARENIEWASKQYKG